MDNIFPKENDLIKILESKNELVYNNMNVELVNNKITMNQSIDSLKYDFMSDDFKDINGYIFNIKNNSLKIKILSSMWIDCSLIRVNFNIYKICSENFESSAKKIYKIIFPCSHKVDYIQHYNLFECFGFIKTKNDRKIKFIIFPIANYEFRLYSINGDYIVIDCESEIDFETFEKYYKIILTAYCFIIGFAPVAKGYAFGHKHNSCEYDSFIYDANAFTEYNSKIKIIDTNIYSYSEDTNTQNEIRDKLKRISKESISKLTNHMLKNQKFYEAMCIMFDINNIGSFGRSTASLYAIRLEMITSIVCDEHKYKQDIEHKDEKSTLQKQLDEIAQDYYSKNIPDEKYKNSIIQKRINALLQPTNRDKLRMPFDILGISLSNDDIKQLERRNDLLHGNSLYKNKDLSLEDEAREILYLNFQLNYLVNALILKYIGYSGIVRNLSKIIEITSSLEAVKNEKPYKII